MYGERLVGSNVSKNSGLAEAHGESVVRVVREEVMESLLREFWLF